MIYDVIYLLLVLIEKLTFFKKQFHGFCYTITYNITSVK